MNLYEKKIVYLHKEGGDKDTGNCGFVSFQCIPGGYKLTVQIRHLQDVSEEKEVLVYLATEEQFEIGRLLISGTSGSGTFRFSGSQEEVKLGERRISVDRITEIRILLWKEQVIVGSFRKQIPEQKKAGEEQKAEENLENKPGNGQRAERRKSEQAGERDGRELRLRALEEADVFSEDLKLIPDKWKQLKQQYGLLHPFGDEREFISVRPADFVILRQEYQKLVNNSFLLHGYYNYRHMILGKDVRLGGNGEVCFYLGVPGVFYEREKMVAVMFGFEGFETEGPVEIGKFGYYLRKVEI